MALLRKANKIPLLFWTGYESSKQKTQRPRVGCKQQMQQKISAQNLLIYQAETSFPNRCHLKFSKSPTWKKKNISYSAPGLQ